MYWKLNHPNNIQKNCQDFFHQQSAINILDSGLVSPSQPHLVMPKNCSMLCICSRTCQEQWPQEPHLSLVTIRYSKHLPDEIVNGAFGKCLSGTRCVNKMYNPTTAIKTITQDNYVRIFLNDSLSVFNKFFETLSVALTQNEIPTHVAPIHAKNMNNTIVQLPLLQTNMAFEPQKKTLNFRYTSCCTGIPKMFFSYIIPT